MSISIVIAVPDIPSNRDISFPSTSLPHTWQSKLVLATLEEDEIVDLLWE